VELCGASDDIEEWQWVEEQDEEQEWEPHAESEWEQEREPEQEPQGQVTMFGKGGHGPWGGARMPSGGHRGGAWQCEGARRRSSRAARGATRSCWWGVGGVVEGRVFSYDASLFAA